MAKRLLFYISHKYNKRSVVIRSEYLYKLFKYKNTRQKYSRGLIIIGSEYLYKPYSTSIDHLYLRGR